MLMQTQVKMSLQEFSGYVAENIRNYMPPEYGDADVSIREVYKDNDTELVAVDVKRSGETVVPSVYLNDLYDRYVGGEDPAELVSRAADMRVIHDAENLVNSRILTNSIMDYETAKKNLVISICCTEWNQHRLEGKVCRQVGEFSEFYRVAVNLDPEGPDIYSSVAVTEDILGMWGISREQLHADAILAEDARKPVLYCMNDLMMEFTTGKEPSNLLDLADGETVDNSMAMYCLTTSDRVNGAALMLRDDILSEAAEVLNDDFFILPSSTHEVLLVPECTGFAVEDLSEMVSAVNREQVMPQERLSDHVHYYDRVHHLLINTHDGAAVSKDLDNYREEYVPKEKKQDLPEKDMPKMSRPHKRRGR